MTYYPPQTAKNGLDAPNSH